MNTYYLAIDIGASSGRHILGTVENGRVKMEEIHRFSNGMTKENGMLCWNLEKLFEEIKIGLKKCKTAGKIPVSVGIDTWAVDFVLLDEAGELTGRPVGYRDERTKGMDRKVYEKISKENIYYRTGIQKQDFNTVYQLMAVKEKHPEELERAETMLMIPDYFHYLLTGERAAEYTNATTTQLVSPDLKNWDEGLISLLGYPRKIFPRILKPGTTLGVFTEGIVAEVGFSCDVVLPATHDTGSAVLAVPSVEENTMYISSGTWSLMGVERREADCSEESRCLNFTNEGGYGYQFRYLKNIMGLWMIQSLKKELQETYSFSQLCEMAEKSEITSLVDCNHPDFLAPKSMIEAVQEACRETRQEVPEHPAELARVIYRSLAECYKNTAKEIEDRMGCTYRQIYVVGGGANAGYLNQLTADAAKRPVLAGPTEATAIGNLMAQMLKAEEWKSLEDARLSLRKSFDIKTYYPRGGKGNEEKTEV